MFNCYVVPSPKDSRGGIIDTLSRMIEIMSRGGGVGINVSSLRPRRAKVIGVNGRSSGSVSWSALYSFGTGLVEQGGSRMGALLIALHDWHPDLLEFINAKKKPGYIENANMSVAISDAFMNAARNHESWTLRFPDTTHPRYDAEWDGDIILWESKGLPVVVYDTVDAYEVLRMLTDAAWSSAEPGILWLERYNTMSNSYYFQNLISVNPCVTGDTVLLTKSGYQTIESLVDIKTEIWNGFEWSEVTPQITGTNQDILDIEFSDGAILACTPYHGFVLSNETKVKAQDLSIGDKLQKYIFPVIQGTLDIEEKLAYTVGVFAGDGSIETGVRDRRSIWLYGKKQELLPYLLYTHSNKCAGDRTYIKLPPEVTYSKTFVPSAEHTIATRLNWLAGLIDTDGALNSPDGSVNISSVDREFLMKVKFMLNTLGVTGTVSLMKEASLRLLPDGKGGHKEYPCQDCYRIVICASRIKVLHDLGLNTHRVPTNPAPDRDASRFIQVTSVTLRAEKEPIVYCFNEPKRHLGCFNGVVTSNCGEQGLPPDGVCCLAHLNLAKVFDRTTGKVNWKLLRHITMTAYRALDNVIDATPYFDTAVEYEAKRTRRIGMGTMGLAELLIRLKLPYKATPKTLAFVDRLYGFITCTLYEASSNMAVIKGSFPAFDADKFLESGFAKTLPERIRNLIRKQGLRNVCLTTQAPTGSSGSMVGTSTGIEPFFAVRGIERKSRLGTDSQDNNVIEQWVSDNPNKKLPSYFVGAMDITAEDHIRIQAVIQRWTDSSISKTVNVPSTTTKDEIFDLHLLAYDLGCKGVTIYRDGSRDSQPLTVNAEAKVYIEDDETVAAEEVDGPQVIFMHGARRCPACGNISMFDADGCEHCEVCGAGACSR